MAARFAMMYGLEMEGELELMMLQLTPNCWNNTIDPFLQSVQIHDTMTEINKIK